jgi:hypothetical protein
MRARLTGNCWRLWGQSQSLEQHGYIQREEHLWIGRWREDVLQAATVRPQNAQTGMGERGEGEFGATASGNAPEAIGGGPCARNPRACPAIR